MADFDSANGGVMRQRSPLFHNTERPQFLGMLASALVQRPLGGCQSDGRSAHLSLGLHSLLRRNVRIINQVLEVVHGFLSVLTRLLLCSAGVRLVFRSFSGGFRLFGFSRLRAFGFRLASLCHVRAPVLGHRDCASQSLPI